MDTLAPVRLDREALAARYRANRARTRAIFATIAPAAQAERPLPLRHPFVFYEGHIPVFAFITLVRDALGRPSIDPELEQLFNRGIDPADEAAAAAHRRSAWPDEDRRRRLADACDAAVLDAYARAELVDAGNPRLVRGEAAYTILEHEEMHQETLLYILRLLTRDRQRPWRYAHRDEQPARRDPIAIGPGRATLGADRAALAFGWDNEFERHEVDVAGFAVDACNVTNGDWLGFVRDGGPVPPQWFERDGAWYLRGVFEDLPLPRSWPVYVANQAAAAYCAWGGGRLPTEAEYHRAAYGSPAGLERPYPWGADAPDPRRHGNFGFRRVDPEPAGASPDGASAWGVHDLVGNGWEWTSTPFAPFAGFREMASYPRYSRDFFDGRHVVMKGAGPATAATLVRSSLRNWFYADYPYMDATFRRVYD